MEENVAATTFWSGLHKNYDKDPFLHSRLSRGKLCAALALLRRRNGLFHCFYCDPEGSSYYVTNLSHNLI